MTQIGGTQATAYRLARVRGRSIGSIFFSGFGAVWLLMSAFVFRHLSTAVVVALAGVTFASVSIAVWLLRTVSNHLIGDAQRESDGRRFGWVNAGQGAAIFLAIQIANNLHHPNAAFPVMALIVGLHFFVLPRSFRQRSNLVTGATITAGAVLCPLLFHGDSMVGAVTLWSGATLWCSAAWALASAIHLLRSLQPMPTLAASQA